MGWYKRRLGILTAIATTTIACDAVDHDEPPAWRPWDELDGKLRPEVEQVPTAQPPPPGFRVVTYNVLRGIELDEDSAYFFADADLASAGVIALQEVERRIGAAESDAGLLARRLGMGHVFIPTYDADDTVRGIALLSRFQLLDIQVMQLREQTELGITQSTARAALKALIKTSTGYIQIITVHLDVQLNVPERILQLRPAVLDAPWPVAVAGDFNTNDYVWAAETIPILPLDGIASTSQADALDDYMRTIRYDTPTAQFGNTWHGVPEHQRLDAVFTRGLASGRGAVERGLDTSDHWPLWLDVSLP